MTSWNRTVGDKLKGVSSNPIILKRRRFKCREVKWPAHSHTTRSQKVRSSFQDKNSGSAPHQSLGGLGVVLGTGLQMRDSVVPRGWENLEAFVWHFCSSEGPTLFRFSWTQAFFILKSQVTQWKGHGEWKCLLKKAFFPNRRREMDTGGSVHRRV